MKNLLMKLWKEEEGAETAEWLIIVALIAAVAIALYTGVLQTALSGLINNISTTIQGIGT
jgi:Flp pilus assembly pilin Flp